MKTILGSISTGTVRHEDLIPVFLDVLRELDEDSYNKLLEEWRDSLPHTGEYDIFQSEKFAEWLSYSEETFYLLDEIELLLQECSPPYCYFGTHEGDGADFGFWPDWSSIELDRRMGDPPMLPSGDETPSKNGFDYNPEHDDYFLQVNDHGNTTLYRWDKVSANSGHWIEVWSVV